MDSRPMSFAAEVREELCREIPGKKCDRLAMCYGIFLYCNTFTRKELRIVTENPDFAALLPRLIRKTFGIDLPRSPQERGKRIFLIQDPRILTDIFAAYGQEHDALALHVNFGVLEEDCCRQAFVRGAFLAGGSVTDPDKRYHLELATSHRYVCSETRSLLQELGFDMMNTRRGGDGILYLKQSDRIVDFLTLIGAPLSAMKIIQAKMEKQVRNGVNRRVNCDTANLTKAVDAAQEQLSAIRLLRSAGRFDSLPQKLQQSAVLREENPEATLSELAAMSDPPISKPAMSHRMKSLVEKAKHDQEL